MEDSDKSLAMEKRLAAAWRNQPVEWTPDCLDPEDIMGLAERGGKYPQAKSLFEHIAKCDYCLREYSDVQRALALSQENPSVSTPAWREMLRKLFPVPHLKPSLQWGGIALAGAGAMLLFLAPRLNPGNSLRNSDADRMQRLQATAEKEQQSQRAQIGALQSESKSLQAQNTQLQQQIAKQRLTGEVALQSARKEMAQVQERLRQSELARKQGSTTGFEASFGKLMASAQSNSQELKGLQDGKRPMMGTDKITLISPCAERVGGLPQFLWSPFPAASHYRLTLTSMRDGTTLYRKERLSDTHWDLPVSQVLTPGVYQWKVEAYSKGSGASTEDVPSLLAERSAQFVVKAPADAHAYKILRDAHLQMARYYRKAGRLHDARQEYRLAFEADPTNIEARQALQN